jgi:hypothetical protein
MAGLMVSKSRKAMGFAMSASASARASSTTSLPVWKHSTCRRVVAGSSMPSGRSSMVRTPSARSSATRLLRRRFVGERARKGESATALLEDYPALSAEDLEFARMFVALGRPPGRPRKKLKFVRGDG